MTADKDSAVLERKVVFATDLEGAVAQGLAIAARSAHERAATLVIMHVLPLRRTDGEAMLHSSLSLMHDRSAARLHALVPKDSRVPFTHVYAVGDPAEEIASYVQRQPVELLVLESRRRTFFHRLWGTDLTSVLRNTTECAILSYRDSADTTPAAPAPRRVAGDPFEALAVILDARVDALARWMTTQREAVVATAERPTVIDGIAKLVQGSASDADRSLLELELEEHCSALGATGFEVLFDGQPLLQSGSAAASSEQRDAFLEKATRGRSAVSLPLEPHPAGERASPVVLAAALVQVPEIASPPTLILVHDARQYFLRVLAQPGPTPTAETYAFDSEGVMISNSRFPEHLRRLGLLPAEPGVQAAGRVRVSDPKAKPTGEPPLASGGVLPLTRMALSATAGESDSDWHGYRDYRGVDVVGTWRWVAEHGFGVAAEMDRPRSGTGPVESSE